MTTQHFIKQKLRGTRAAGHAVYLTHLLPENGEVMLSASYLCLCLIFSCIIMSAPGFTCRDEITFTFNRCCKLQIIMDEGKLFAFSEVVKMCSCFCSYVFFFLRIDPPHPHLFPALFLYLSIKSSSCGLLVTMETRCFALLTLPSIHLSLLSFSVSCFPHCH